MSTAKLNGKGALAYLAYEAFYNGGEVNRLRLNEYLWRLAERDEEMLEHLNTREEAWRRRETISRRSKKWGVADNDYGIAHSNVFCRVAEIAKPWL